jgi:hypothetical protein
LYSCKFCELSTKGLKTIKTCIFVKTAAVEEGAKTVAKLIKTSGKNNEEMEERGTISREMFQRSGWEQGRGGEE